MKASEFYEYLYGEKPPKNFQNSSSIHVFGFAEAYVEYLKQGQTLPIDSVSQQRELLLAFLKCYNNGEVTEYGINEVDDFLKHNS